MCVCVYVSVRVCVQSVISSENSASIDGKFECERRELAEFYFISLLASLSEKMIAERLEMAQPLRRAAELCLDLEANETATRTTSTETANCCKRQPVGITTNQSASQPGKSCVPFFQLVLEQSTFWPRSCDAYKKIFMYKQFELTQHMA